MIYYEDVELMQRHESPEYLVDKEEMMAFSRQWDPRPIHIDEAAASHWPTGLIGSSTQSYAILTKLQTESEVAPLAMVGGLGIESMRMPTPLRAGDRVRAVGYVESKRESSSKPGMGILVSVSTLLNQHGEVILTYKSAGLVLKRPAAE